MASKKKKKYTKFWRVVKVQLVLLFLITAGLLYYTFGDYGKQVQALKQDAVIKVRDSDLHTFSASLTSIVYDQNKQVITKMKGEKDVYYLSYDQIPINALTAIVSMEDKNFYQHKGVDYKAILRAAIAILRNFEVTQGGSTITQQLARNIYLSQDKTWQRKVEEIFLAIELEKKYNKKQILEFYMNNVYFGNGFYGIEAASQGYFNQSVNQLSLAEITFICAIPNNPTLYNPLTNKENTISRKNRMLSNMYEDEVITYSAYEEACSEEIMLITQSMDKNDYVETFVKHCAVKSLMAEDGFEFRSTFDSKEDEQNYQQYYDLKYAQYQKLLFTGGYRIDTSIDLSIQEGLQNQINQKLKGYTQVNEEGIYQLQGAGVCINNETGMVTAIVGGRSQNYDGYTLNRAYQSYRQPGSALKPLLVYTPILETDYTPSSIVSDVLIKNGPTNGDGSYSGEITLAKAVAESKNTVAWNLLEELTPAKGISYLKAMNFSKLSEEDERLSAALGGLTTGASPLEMAAGYTTIENDGVYREPNCIVKITDSQGNLITEPKVIEKKVYKTQATRMMTKMLEGVLSEGTGKELQLKGMVAAGKTGTTNENKDGWFVGYTSYYTTAVWVGYDIPQSLTGLTGAGVPGEIWRDFMDEIHQDKQLEEFPTYIEKSKE